MAAVLGILYIIGCFLVNLIPAALFVLLGLLILKKRK